MKFYRYYDRIYKDGPHIHEMEFSLVKETQKGYWIKSEIDYILSKKPKWISKTARKRYAYPTKEEALKNYIARKQRQILILKDRLSNAELCLDIAKYKQGKENE